MGRTDERRDSSRGGDDLLERPGRGFQEAGTQEQVLGRIAGDGELGKEHEVGCLGPRLLELREDPLAVAVEVADDGVDLGQREPHGTYSSRLRLRSENY